MFIESYPRPPGSPSNSFKIFPSQAFPFSAPLRSHKPFRCNTYKKHGVGVPSTLPQLSSVSHLQYTLPSSVSRNSFICHSYENTGGGGDSSRFGTWRRAEVASVRSQREFPVRGYGGRQRKTFGLKGQVYRKWPTISAPLRVIAGRVGGNLKGQV